MNKISKKGVLNPMSEREMKMVKGGNGEVVSEIGGDSDCPTKSCGSASDGTNYCEGKACGDTCDHPKGVKGTCIAWWTLSGTCKICAAW